MRVAVSVFLFLARVRFPNSKSIAKAIRARYNGNNDKRMQKLEKIDYRLRKAELDLEFLCNCSDNNAVSKFLNFRVANNHIKFSTTYEQYQSNLLKEEIRQKKIECTNRILQKEFTSLKSNVRILQKEFTSLKASLQNELNLIDFALVRTLRNTRQDFEIKMESDPVKVIFNFSKYELSDAEKRPLARGLNFCLAPEQLN